MKNDQLLVRGYFISSHEYSIQKYKLTLEIFFKLSCCHVYVVSFQRLTVESNKPFLKYEYDDII